MADHLTEVLVIDDDRFARESAAKALRAAGFKVRKAHSCEMAWEILRDKPQLRLVVCDWVMPGMSGIALLRRLRADADRRSTFVLICTSNTDSAHIAAAYDAGADDYVSKPWSEAELVARVRSGQQRIALDTSEALVFSLAALAESRDPDTGAHLERVRRYCRTLALALAEETEYADELDGQLIHLIEQTSVLHDIGKVGIPDAILRKPGLLTRAEFKVMKSHTRIGARSLRTALRLSCGAPFLNVAHQIALHHHERWDGSGYPSGLTTHHIPLSARILAVADVYDALTTRRVYKESSTHEEAIATIVDGAGTHFDPLIVNSLVQHQSEFDDIRRRHADTTAPPRDVTSTRVASPPQPVATS